jgi:DNA gyrase subunit A
MSEPDDTLEDQIRAAQDRLHVLEGLVRALEDPHALLDVLLRTDDVASARQALQTDVGLSEIQALATLDLQFRRAPRQELQKIVDARDELAAQLERLIAARRRDS